MAAKIPVMVKSIYMTLDSQNCSRKLHVHKTIVCITINISIFELILNVRVWYKTIAVSGIQSAPS